MLVLTRKLNETIVIGDAIRVTVTQITGGKVRIAIATPDDVAVLREELYRAKQAFADAPEAIAAE